MKQNFRAEKDECAIGIMIKPAGLDTCKRSGDPNEVAQLHAMSSPVSPGNDDDGTTLTSPSRTSEDPGLNLLCQAAAVNNPEQDGSSSVAVSNVSTPGNGSRNKKPWTAEEDELLKAMVQKHGANKWTVIADSIPGRTGKQARERWLNQLHPDLKRKGWTAEEDCTIIEAHARYGNKWSQIAQQLKGRTDNSIKNRFNSTLKRRLQRQSSPTTRHLHSGALHTGGHGYHRPCILYSSSSRSEGEQGYVPPVSYSISMCPPYLPCYVPNASYNNYPPPSMYMYAAPTMFNFQGHPAYQSPLIPRGGAESRKPI